jgi:tRNA modification GTPase
MQPDTIAAISTPLGEGGIAIIRISGPKSLEIADKIFVSARKKPSKLPTHTIHFGAIGRNGDLVDHVMLSVMRAPRTYTREDTVEINCHGGILPAKKILQLALENGARLAEPGEFTKRAFLNGRIDLAQAEAVMDLIRARTERALHAAAHQLDGSLSKKVNAARDSLITTLAHIEAHIDFPDEDIAPDTRESLKNSCESVKNLLEALLKTADEGKILRHGIKIAIVGRPNVGKSSVMNALLAHERSIVTPIAGTTRDVVEDFANIRGIPVHLSDTAGIRNARGQIEKIGVERSHKSLEISDLVLHVVDGSRQFYASDRHLAELVAKKSTILVINKIDLGKKIRIPEKFSKSVVEISAKTGEGIEQLKDKIFEIAASGVGSADADVTVNARHADALRRGIGALDEAILQMKREEELEIIASTLRQALDAVGEIVGKTTTEDILDKIFSTFCIGK